MIVLCITGFVLFPPPPPPQHTHTLSPLSFSSLSCSSLSLDPLLLARSAPTCQLSFQFDQYLFTSYYLLKKKLVYLDIFANCKRGCLFAVVTRTLTVMMIQKKILTRRNSQISWQVIFIFCLFITYWSSNMKADHLDFVKSMAWNCSVLTPTPMTWNCSPPPPPSPHSSWHGPSSVQNKNNLFNDIHLCIYMFDSLLWCTLNASPGARYIPQALDTIWGTSISCLWWVGRLTNFILWAYRGTSISHTQHKKMEERIWNKWSWMDQEGGN